MKGKARSQPGAAGVMLVLDATQGAAALLSEAALAMLQAL
jgi:hypothetical protein